MDRNYNPARMATLKHPGIAVPERITTRSVQRLPTLSCTVAPGSDMFGTIEAALVRDGIKTAFFRLGAGVLESLTIMTGAEIPGSAANGGPPVGFCGPHVIAAPAQVVTGSGLCGLDEDGGLTCHSHAVFIDSCGHRVGGHLILGKAIAGIGGVSLEIIPVRGAAFQRAKDRETGFAIFHPVAV